jgi:hypothetical protein
MVTGLSKPWAVTGVRAPLSVRWEAAATKLAHLGSSLPGPCTESNLVDGLREIEKLSKPTPEPDLRLDHARIDLNSEIAEHTQLREKIIKEQRQLEPISDEHRLLADISAAMLRKPEETQACVDRLWPRVPRQTSYRLPGEVAKPAFQGPDAVDQFRAATRAMQAENDRLRDLLGDITKIWQHDALALADRNRRMILAMYSMLNAMAERLDFLEQSITIEQSTKQRSRRHG